MARNGFANGTNPPQPRHRDQDRHDDGFRPGLDDFDDRGGRHDVSCNSHGASQNLDVNLDISAGGFDLDINIDGHRNKADIDIDIDSGRRGIEIDIDVDIDPRLLVPDSTPMAISLGAEGNAVGIDTLVDADIVSRAVDMGSYTLAYGSATVRSDSVSSDGTALATALTFADVSGADFVFIFNETLSRNFSFEGSAYSEEISRTSYVAIDFDDFDLATGPVVVTDSELAASFGRSGFPGLDGNVATLDVDALAQAQNTLVDVQSSVLTIEDQLSSISAIVVTAVA